jgi:hypothetical protein
MDAEEEIAILNVKVRFESQALKEGNVGLFPCD